SSAPAPPPAPAAPPALAAATPPAAPPTLAAATPPATPSPPTLAPAPAAGDMASTGRTVDLRSLVPPVSVFGPGWSVKSTSTQGSHAAVRVSAAEYVAGDQSSPSAAVIIGVYAAQNDAARDALIPAVRQSFEPQGYTFTPSSDFGDRPGVRGTATRAPAVG